MITEDYVSFETAKLLKEKGFPQEYDKYHSMVYNEEDYENEYESQRMVLETEIVKAGTLSSYPVGVPEPKCYCCTLQMAMKWLRQTHNIHITISLTSDSYYKYEIHRLHSNYPIELKLSEEVEEYYNQYEQACESAVRYCLENLI